jgi:hypothetical protein
MIPTKDENPKGLHQKYVLARVDGKPLEETAEFFILRLDNGAKNPKHKIACRLAVLTYAENIAGHNPILAQDLYERYNIGEDGKPLKPSMRFI